MARFKGVLSRQTPAAPPAAASLVAAEPEPDISNNVGLVDHCLSGWLTGNELFRGFPILAEDVLIDAGCGSGNYAVFAGRQGPHIILCDILAEQVAKAAQRVRETNARDVTEVVQTSELMPLPDQIATKVVCREVLEHVGDPVLFMSELVRVAKPGALFLISVPHPASESLQALAHKPAYFQPPNHVRIVSPEQFKALVTDAGLVIENYETHGFYSMMALAFLSICDTDLETRQHPLLYNWGRTWRTLLETEGGVELKKKFDSYLPNSQVIIARKPG